MATDFPSAPAEGQVFNAAPGKSFVFRNGLWRKAPLTTALPKNYIVNPAMQISQQNGDASVATSLFPADQWQGSSTIAGAAFARGRPSLSGSDYIGIALSTAKPALAASDAHAMRQLIEGTRVVDLQWGTANAKQAVLRFAAATATGGTFVVTVKNSDANRTFIAPFTMPSGWTWTTFGIVIPGDTTGTWLTTANIGMNLSFNFATGTSLIGAAGWQAGNWNGLPGMTNGAAVTGSYLITDVGLYADPYKTGVAPLFRVPDFGDELRRCQRYWYRRYGMRGWVTAATTVGRLAAPHPAPMRTTPATAIVGAPKVYDLGATPTITAISADQSNTLALEINATCGAGGLTAGRPALHYWTTESDYLAVSARM